MSTETRLRAIVGLGNPGAEYERTRHNAGFWLVDRLAAQHKGSLRMESKFQGELGRVNIGGAEVLLFKPMTFMNRSGEPAQKLVQFYKLAPEDLLFAHDELDLPAGTVRLKSGGGHGGHNGLRSLHQHLGADYLRLRIGIGHPGHKDLVHDYVLGRASKADEALILDAIDKAAAAIPVWLSQTWERAVHQLHSRESGMGNGES
jgi:PTH1 family peptidyl-tRNA hydrolase